MSSRFIAIFALHFFLSVSAFAFGGAHIAAVAQTHALSPVHQAASGPEAAVQKGEALADSAVNPVVVGEAADLPDSLPRTVMTERPPIEGGLSIGYRQRAVLPPSLDGLLRPPRHARPLA